MAYESEAQTFSEGLRRTQHLTDLLNDRSERRQQYIRDSAPTREQLAAWDHREFAQASRERRAMEAR
jgi:hypothetical protein